MRQAFITNALNFIENNQKQMTEEEKEKLQYGLECLYITITKFVVLFALSLFLGIFKHFIFILIFFNILRYPAFGFHAGNSIMCFILSSLLFIFLPYFLLQVDLPLPIIYTVLAITIACFLLFAPADTVKRPLTNKKRRRLRKIISSSLAIIYSFLIILFNGTLIAKYLLIALLLETIAILPFTYWIFGQPYANYKKV